MYENHFQEEELKEIDIDGAKFKYKPTTAGEENEWLKEYMILDAQGNLIQDMSALNKCKLRNLKVAPYPKELIKKYIGFEKEWAELNDDERWQIFSKLKPSFFSKLIKAINQIDLGTEEELKQKKN